ncbi:MAG: PilZ domain-containing protein [Betaproteobacteria bacterium]|nr:PilZ domain-containing protein [Betaproteobacteria bacterium]
MGHRLKGEFTLEQFQELTEFFPVGKKLRYFPDYKKDIVFDTLLVAYCVNGQFLYSWEAVELDEEGTPLAFHVGERKTRIPVEKVVQFQLLVPDTSDLELTLDYDRRAVLGRGRQFLKGNDITLIANAGVKGVATVDTQVAKQLILKDGPYANTKMVLLTPDLDDITVTDQRRQARAKACVPVNLSWGEHQLHGPCTLVDMSESAVRVRVRDGESPLPPLKSGDRVMLDINLGGNEDQHYTIQGSIFRRTVEVCVITIEGAIKAGRLTTLTPLELLELKASLLNYGK